MLVAAFFCICLSLTKVNELRLFVARCGTLPQTWKEVGCLGGRRWITRLAAAGSRSGGVN